MKRLNASTRLLLRVPSWLGDFVMAEPVIAACAEAVRDGRLQSVSLAGPSRFFELIDGRFDSLRLLTDEQSWRGHDAAVFLDGSLRSLWRAARAGIGERWSWFSGGRFLLASGGCFPARERGATPLQLGKHGGGARLLPRPFGSACAELLGLAGLPVVGRAPRLMASGAAIEGARARLSALGLELGEPYLALDASARPGSAKAAPPEKWAALLGELQAQGAPRAVLLTAPGEEASAIELAALAPEGFASLTQPPPGLPELLALLEGAELFLGADSGPRHLAQAVGTRAEVFFGPSDPRHTADHTANCSLHWARVSCGPCHDEACGVVGDGRMACWG